MSIVVATLVFTLLACRQSASLGLSPTRPASLHGAIIQPAIAKPEITLTDTSGQPFDLRRQTQGYVTILYLGYTHCPDECPTTMADFSAALRSLPANTASHVKVLFVTTDPERDTPNVLRNWLDAFDPRFVGLRGSADQLAALERDLHLPPAEKEASDGAGDYGVSHAAFALVFTAADNIAHTVYPVGFSRADLASDITLLSEHGWRNN